jgi:hypothetical protein
MASLGRVLGGIAASPFRAAGKIAKGTAKLGYAGAKGLAMSAMDVSGALPIFMGAVGGVKAIGKGIGVGKELLRPIGAGAVTEDSAHKAIAAAASETARLDAETKKIEAKTAALTGTSMGGIDVDILQKIYGEVVSIRGILGGKDPASEKKELALDEQTRHKKFLEALAGLGFGGKGDGKDKGPGGLFGGDLMGMIKGLVPAIIAGLGIAGLIKLWPKIATTFESISDAIANINEFLADMEAFFSMAGFDFFGAGALISGIRRGIKTGPKLKRNVGRTVDRGQYKRGVQPKGRGKYRGANQRRYTPTSKPYAGAGQKTLPTRTGSIKPYVPPYKSFAGRNLVNRLGDERYTGRNLLARPYSQMGSGYRYTGVSPFKMGYDKMGSGVRALPYAGAGQKTLPTRTGSIKPYVPPYKSFAGRNLVDRLGEEKLPSRPIQYDGGDRDKGGRRQGTSGSWARGLAAARAGLALGGGQMLPAGFKMPRRFRPTAPRITSGVSGPGTGFNLDAFLESRRTPTLLDFLDGADEQIDDTKPRKRMKPRRGGVRAGLSSSLERIMSGRTGSTFKPRRGGTGAGVSSLLEKIFKRRAKIARGPGTVSTTMPAGGIPDVYRPISAGGTAPEGGTQWNKVLQKWVAEYPLISKALGGLARGAGGLLAAYFLWRDVSSAAGLWYTHREDGDKWPFGSDPADLQFKQAMNYLMAVYGMSMYGAVAGATLMSPLLPPAGAFIGAILGGGASFIAGDWIWKYLMGDPAEFMDYDADLLGTEGKKGVGDFFTKPAASGKKKPSGRRLGLGTKRVWKPMPKDWKGRGPAAAIKKQSGIDKLLETEPDKTGSALTQAGANGGILKADVIVTNINSTTNSDHQTVSSVAQTSTIITVERPKGIAGGGRFSRYP